MCFSAEASLSVGLVLLPAGAYAVAAARRKNPRYLPLAAVPLLFGMQQICEAVVWVGMGREDAGLVRLATLAYLFFAVAFWPVWMPLATAVIEPPGTKRRVFLAFLGLGLVIGITGYWMALCKIGRGEGEAMVQGHSIQYGFPDRDEGLAIRIWSRLYLLACAPPLLSRDRRVRIFAIVMMASAVVSYLLFHYAFASVWCFFSAALSAYLCHMYAECPPGAS